VILIPDILLELSSKGTVYEKNVFVVEPNILAEVF